MKSQKSVRIVDSKPNAAPTSIQKIASRSIGLFTVLLLTVMFIQLTPLLVAFIGAYVGIPADGAAQNADIVVWVLSSLAVLAATVVMYLRVVFHVWGRMVVNTLLFFKKDRAE